MKKVLLPVTAVLAIALASALAFAGGDKKDKKQMAGPKPGDHAPAFALQDQTGRTVSSDELKGKIIVLEWFNDECPYVVKHYQDGHMNKLAEKYMDQGVVWLAIDSTSTHNAEKNKAIAKKWNIDRPILSDASGEVGKAYGSRNTPTMYIIDKEGILVYRGAIDSKSDADTASIAGATNYVAVALDEVLAGKPVSTPETKAYGCSVKYAK
jgi:peroxiredoxin